MAEKTKKEFANEFLSDPKLVENIRKIYAQKIISCEKIKIERDCVPDIVNDFLDADIPDIIDELRLVLLKKSKQPISVKDYIEGIAIEAHRETIKNQ